MENFVMATHSGWGSNCMDTMENIFLFLGREKFQLAYSWQDANSTTTKISPKMPQITHPNNPNNVNNLNSLNSLNNLGNLNNLGGIGNLNVALVSSLLSNPTGLIFPTTTTTKQSIPTTSVKPSASTATTTTTSNTQTSSNAPNAFDTDDALSGVFNAESFFANSQPNKIVDDENSNKPLLISNQQHTSQASTSVLSQNLLGSPPQRSNKEEETPFFMKQQNQSISNNNFVTMASPLTRTPPSKSSVDFENFSPLFSTPKLDLRKPGFMSPNNVNSGRNNNFLSPINGNNSRISGESKENTPNMGTGGLLLNSNERSRQNFPSNEEDEVGNGPLMNDPSLFPAIFPTPNNNNNNLNNSFNGNDQSVSLSLWCKQDSQDSFSSSNLKGFLN